MPFNQITSPRSFARAAVDEEELDPVIQPAHYTAHPSGIEAVTIASGFCFALGNVIKYVWRAGLKTPDPLPDLRKARWYLDYHIRELERKRDGGDGRHGA
jgi:hypothetical protein